MIYQGKFGFAFVIAYSIDVTEQKYLNKFQKSINYETKDTEI